MLSILLLVVVPPYFSISRYQRRVATAISGALGRPVHFDNITVHLLPIPGLTIANFVVNESPEFGAEPVLRANTVEARLRVSSLWRRRIEVSRISLDSPSINLVRRRADGRWNLQGILLQASQLESAPTAQKRAGDAPRFPYIEATDARINIKSDADKLPFSVKEAEFALWLPQPDQWRLRMVGKPVRTDTDVSDVGLLRVEATVGRATDLPKTAIDLSASWKPTPLGEAAKLAVGNDRDWRGEVSATAALHGTLQTAKLVADLHLSGLHRADFLPAQNAEVEAHCEAATSGLLRSLQDVRCAVPTDTALSLSGVIDSLRRLPAADVSAEHASRSRLGVLLIQAEVPNVLDWRNATGSASLKAAPAQYAMTWARLFLQSIPPAVQVGGTFDLEASAEPGEEGSGWTGTLTCRCVLPQPARAAKRQSEPPKSTEEAANLWTVSLWRSGQGVLGSGVNLMASPGLGSEDPDAKRTSVPVAGEISRAGYLLRYTNVEAVRQVAAVIPAFGAGVPSNAGGPLAAGGDWYRPPVWTETPSAERQPPGRARRRRR